jgi:exosortase/archaeosortase family protein
VSDAEKPGEASARSLGYGFALRYALIAGVGFVAYGFPYAESGISERGFELYLQAYARVVGTVLGWFEPGLVVHGTHLVGRFPLEIAKNCDAAEANILLASALLAFPAPIARRIMALAIGVMLLALLNVVRISSLYFIGLHARSWFDAAHLELWPLVLIGFAAVEFLLLARWLLDQRVMPDVARAASMMHRSAAAVIRRAGTLAGLMRRGGWRSKA